MVASVVAWKTGVAAIPKKLEGARSSIAVRSRQELLQSRRSRVVEQGDNFGFGQTKYWLWHCYELLSQPTRIHLDTSIQLSSGLDVIDNSKQIQWNLRERTHHGATELTCAFDSAGFLGIGSSSDAEGKPSIDVS